MDKDYTYFSDTSFYVIKEDSVYKVENKKKKKKNRICSCLYLISR